MNGPCKEESGSRNMEASYHDASRENLPRRFVTCDEIALVDGNFNKKVRERNDPLAWLSSLTRQQDMPCVNSSESVKQTFHLTRR